MQLEKTLNDTTITQDTVAAQDGTYVAETQNQYASQDLYTPDGISPIAMGLVMGVVLLVGYFGNKVYNIFKK